jgi:hypothetical protein
MHAYGCKHSDCQILNFPNTYQVRGILSRLMLIKVTRYTTIIIMESVVNFISSLKMPYLTAECSNDLAL